MKKLLPFLGLAVLIAACNPSPQPTEPQDTSTQQTLRSTDTLGLNAFNNWKITHELAEAKQTSAPVYTQPARTISRRAPVSTGRSTRTRSSNQSGSISTTSSQTAKAQKKGWSKAAKGAVIGGVVGAAGGAILDKKNRVLGAVIGGVIGAAGGYGIGHGMDKKDGRANLAMQ